MFVASIRAYFVLIGNPHQFREVSPDDQEEHYRNRSFSEEFRLGGALRAEMAGRQNRWNG